MNTKGQINPGCKDCSLHAGTSCVCMAGRGDTKGTLMIFTDFPDYFATRARRAYALETGRFLNHLFERMSIDPKRIVYEYTLRCYAQKTLPTTKAGRLVCIQECAQYRFATIAKHRPKAIVTFGQASLEAFTGRTKLKDNNELKVPTNELIVSRRYGIEHVWCGYSVQYALMAPSEAPDMGRILWYASKEAGLKPKYNPNVPPFQWPNITK